MGFGIFGGGSSSSSTTSQTFNRNSSATGDLSGDQSAGAVRISAGGDTQTTIENANTTDLINAFKTIQEGNQGVFAGVLQAQNNTFAATTGALSSAQQAQSGDTIGRLNTTLGGVGSIIKTLLPALIVAGLVAGVYFFNKGKNK